MTKKPGDPDYQHVDGQMDVYDVLEEIEAEPTRRRPKTFEEAVADVVALSLKQRRETQDERTNQGE